MSWEVYKLKLGEKRFLLVGNGLRFHGEVWQGAQKGDVFWGLKAMEIPACRARLLHSWRIETPYFYSGQKNRGQDRRYLRFVSSTTGPFVLRFEETVTAELLDDLRTAFSAPHVRKEVRDEKHAGEAELDPAGAAEGRGAGGSVEGEDRNPAGHGSHPGAGRLEKGRKVTRRKKPTKKRRPKKCLSTPQP